MRETKLIFPYLFVIVFVGLLVAGASSGSGTCAELEEISLYGVFETVIDYEALSGKSHSYSDPFYGSELNAKFISPTGRNITWWGFFDGDGKGGQHGNIWKIRFMPDELGVWVFQWQFGDGGISGESSFCAVDTPQIPRKPGPLKHDSYINQWLVTGDGSRHVFLNMLEIVEKLDAWNNPEHHIEQVVANGFDVIMVGGAVSSRSKPMTKKNPFHWMNLEDYQPRLQGWHFQEKGLFREVYKQNIYLYDWAGFYAGNGWINLHKKPISFQNKVIKYWLTRTAPYYFFIFNVGFELPEYVSVPTWTEERAQFIKGIDPWNHIITGHELDGWSYGQTSSIDFSALQNNGFDLKDRVKTSIKKIIKGSEVKQISLRGVSFHEIALTVWNSPSKPHPHCDECIWNAKWQEPGTEDSHRKDLWNGITGGMSYSFYARDSLIGLTAFRNANTFLKSGVQWWTMSPHDEVIVSGKAYALANIGQEYIVYSPSGNGFSINLPSGQYQWQWFNPANGEYGNWQNITSDSGVNTFEKPNPDDWILHVKGN